jgi:hypothetical protein
MPNLHAKACVLDTSKLMTLHKMRTPGTSSRANPSSPAPQLGTYLNLAVHEEELKT